MGKRMSKMGRGPKKDRRYKCIQDCEEKEEFIIKDIARQKIVELKDTIEKVNNYLEKTPE